MTERSYDRTHVGFYLNDIERKLKALEADKKKLVLALEEISNGSCPIACLNHSSACSCCIARDVLKEVGND
jgi:hypothetical protein